MSRYWLFAPTHVWRVMLGVPSDAQAHDAAVVGATTFHQTTLYVWTEPALSAYAAFRPACRRPPTYASWSGLNVLQAWPSR